MSGKNSKRKNSGLLLTTVAIAALCLAVIVVNGRNRSPAQKAGRDAGDATVIAEGESLKIAASGITTDASFFPIEVDGTRMEVIAVRDKEGNIRTAFNTCQICYGSGRGYYVQQGNVLVCQNCGNRFTTEQVEIKSGGCNPWPIFEDDKVITGDSIEISYDFLSASEKIFANWKSDY